MCERKKIRGFMTEADTHIHIYTYSHIHIQDVAPSKLENDICMAYATFGMT